MYFAENPEDANGWDFWALLIVAGASIAFLAMLVVRFIVALSITALFWLANGAGPTLSALAAAVLSLAAMGLMEFAVEAPLCRRWGLPFGEPGRPLDEFCPVPQERE